MPARFSQSAVRLAQGVLDESIADHSAIEIKILVAGRRTGEFRQADDAMNLQLRITGVKGKPLLVKFLGPSREESFFLGGRGKIQHVSAIVEKLELDGRVRKRSLRSISEMCPNSVDVPLMNFRRAGVL